MWILKEWTVKVCSSLSENHIVYFSQVSFFLLHVIYELLEFLITILKKSKECSYKYKYKHRLENDFSD